MAVGTKPALIGQKVNQTYYRGNGYLEIDIDMRVSAVASSILGMVSNFIIHS